MKPLLAPPNSIPEPSAFDIKIDPDIREPLPPMNVFEPGNTTSSIKTNWSDTSPNTFTNSILSVFGSPICFDGIVIL